MLKRMAVLLVLIGLLGGGVYAVMHVIAGNKPLAQAKTLVAQGDLFGAQFVLRNLVKAEPRNVDAHVLLARIQLQMADWFSAEKEIKVARALRYDRAVLTPMLARSYIMLERYRDLLTDIPPTGGTPQEQVSNLVLRSMAYLGLNDVVQAEQTLATAIELAPKDLQVQLQSARIARARQDPATAERLTAEVLSALPEDVDALMLMAELQVARGDGKGALVNMDRAVKIVPFAPYIRLARIPLLLAAGTDKQATEDLDVVFAVSPSDKMALYFDTLLRVRAQKYGDALVGFQRLAPFMEQIPKSYYHEATAFVALGHPESAMDSLSRLLKISPGDVDGVRLAAQIEMKAQRPEKVVAVVLRGVGSGLNDAQSFDMLGRGYFMLGQMPAAIESFRKAVTLAPDNKEFAAHMAAAQSSFGAPSAAKGQTQATPATTIQ